MNITFVCQSCTDSFELDYRELSSQVKGVKCPNCGKRLPPADVDEFITSLDELFEVVVGLRRRFALSFEVDAEDLPAPFDTGRRSGSTVAFDDDDDEDSDEGDDEELLDEDSEDEDDDI